MPFLFLHLYRNLKPKIMYLKKIFRCFILLTALFFLSCEEHSNNEPPYQGPPKGHIISVERAAELYDAYSSRRVPIIQKFEDSIKPDSVKFSPTRYTEFDLETIKQYIAYIEHEAQEANVEINTLRFYLSNYPNADNFPNGDAVKYPRMNSFFVVPTMDYNGENVGFSIEDVDGKYTAVPINRQRTNQKGSQKQNDSTGQMNEAAFFSFNSAASQNVGGSLILNDGQVCPPPGTNDFGN